MLQEIETTEEVKTFEYILNIPLRLIGCDHIVNNVFVDLHAAVIC